MAKSKKRVLQNIGGSKGNLLAERLKSTNLEKVMIVPIEIGKDSHKALLADYFGSIFKESFEFHSSQEGINFLHNTISRVSKEHQFEKIFLSLEATGHYYQKPALSINELGYDNLFILNPLSTKQCRKAGLVWSKTDDIDLKANGQALLSGYGTIYRKEEPIWCDLKEIMRFRRFKVKHQTALKNKIHVCLDNLLPGITKLCMFKDSLWHPASLDFFARYSNVFLVSHLQPHNIVEFFHRRGRRLVPEDGYRLIRWTRQTFNQHSPSASCKEGIMRSLLLELKQVQEKIIQLEVDSLGYLVQLPAVLLLSIDYIGPIRAAEFAGEITPFEQYPTSRALIKGAGLDSTTFQSSTYEAKNHPVSKKGSRSLRYITVDIADAIMRHNDYFAHFANQLMERGKSKDCACIATAARFMRVAFSIIKEQRLFQPSNGLGISKDPLNKIKLFLMERHASDRIEEYVRLAKKYFPDIKGENDNLTR